MTVYPRGPLSLEDRGWWAIEPTSHVWLGLVTATLSGHKRRGQLYRAMVAVLFAQTATHDEEVKVMEMVHK